MVFGGGGQQKYVSGAKTPGPALLKPLFLIDPELEEAAAGGPPLALPLAPPLLCTPSSVPCRNGEGCVSPENLCDGKPDCQDGSDEGDCSRFCNGPGLSLRQECRCGFGLVV